MSGRPRLPIGTFGEITTREVTPHRFRASTRFRDWDGRTRQVSATRESVSAARTALKARIAERMRGGDTSGALTAESPFIDLVDAWLEDLRMDADRSCRTTSLGSC